eukprot:110688-Hanusia_phi.AAC.1
MKGLLPRQNSANFTHKVSARAMIPPPAHFSPPLLPHHDQLFQGASRISALDFVYRGRLTNILVSAASSP